MGNPYILYQVTGIYLYFNTLFTEWRLFSPATFTVNLM